MKRLLVQLAILIAPLGFAIPVQANTVYIPTAYQYPVMNQDQANEAILGSWFCTRIDGTSYALTFTQEPFWYAFSNRPDRIFNAGPTLYYRDSEGTGSVVYHPWGGSLDWGFFRFEIDQGNVRSKGRVGLPSNKGGYWPIWMFPDGKTMEVPTPNPVPHWIPSEPVEPTKCWKL